MRVSMKVDYGVRALMYLAEHHGQGLVQTNEIAQTQSIPEPYLDQLLTTLRKAGFIRSRRGPGGGHTLAKDAEAISLGAVISTLEGSLSPMDCIDSPDECERAEFCPQREVWRTVEEATQRVLAATSIAQLSQQQAKHLKQGMYYI